MPTQEEVDVLLRDLDEANGGMRMTSRALPRESCAVQEFSRWREGPTSFGPKGRIVMTVIVVVPWLFMLFDPLRLGFRNLTLFWFVPWTVIGGVWLLDIWKRARVKYR